MFVLSFENQTVHRMVLTIRFPDTKYVWKMTCGIPECPELIYL
jgi:hypothetical protein